MPIIKNFLGLFRRKAVLFILTIIVLGGFYFFVFGKSSDKSSTYTDVVKGDFIKTVNVSGKVVPVKNVDLSFEVGGTVNSVYKDTGASVSEGEPIVSLESSQLQASKEKALADLESAKAQLAKLQSDGNNAAVLINKQQTIDSINNAYTQSDDAVHNKVDQYFTNGTSVYPQIQHHFDNYYQRNSLINDKRLLVENELSIWSGEIKGLSVDSYNSNILLKARTHLQNIKSFLDILAPAVNSFEVANDLPQTLIDKYKNDLTLARANINSSLSSLSSSESQLTGSVSDIPVVEANVRSAEANVSSVDAQISKTVIKAPFSGTISLQNAKVGQSIGAHELVSSLMSSKYKVEVYIPEINIPGVALGNNATVKFDAYGEEIFKAIVSSIDPAETIKDGVSTYKVTLSFVADDPKIKSGLTSNVFIDTLKKADVTSIPDRSVVSVDGKNYVYKATSKNPVKVEVVLGDKDGKGNSEVLSGVSVQEKILLNPPQN